MTLMNCENLSFAYAGVHVVKDLNFALEEGDYLCIVGENGAGKSTLIKGLLHLKKPASGSITMREDLKAREIGYLPQQNPEQNDFPASVFEIVLSGSLSKLGFRPFYSRKEKDLARANIEKLKISHLEHACYRELSGGQKRRVLLARALTATSRLIILDEPCAGLDPVVTRELYQVIKEVNEKLGITIVMVSHDIRSALEYANKVLHVHAEGSFFGLAEDYRKSTLGKRFLEG